MFMEVTTVWCVCLIIYYHPHAKFTYDKTNIPTRLLHNSRLCTQTVVLVGRTRLILVRLRANTDVNELYILWYNIAAQRCDVWPFNFSFCFMWGEALLCLTCLRDQPLLFSRWKWAEKRCTSANAMQILLFLCDGNAASFPFFPQSAIQLDIDSIDSILRGVLVILYVGS